MFSGKVILNKSLPKEHKTEQQTLTLAITHPQIRHFVNSSFFKVVILRYGAETKYQIQCNKTLYMHSKQYKFMICNEGQNPPKEYSNNLASIEKLRLSNGVGVFVFNPILAKKGQVRQDFHLDLSNKSFNAPISKEYPIKTGQFLKLANTEFVILETRINKQTESIITTASNDFNCKRKEYIRNEEEFQKDKGQDKLQCKICRSDQNIPVNPLISPCSCNGSSKYIHVACLRQWIKTLTQETINDHSTYYQFTKIDCEICKAHYPEIIIVQGKSFDIMPLKRPKASYIIMEELNKASGANRNERHLHVVSFGKNRSAKIGRDSDCTIYVKDLMVSRSHAKIMLKHNQFYIKDFNSRHGTSIKLQGSYRFQQGKPTYIRYGKHVFQFEIVPPSKQEDKKEIKEKHVSEIEENQIKNQPTMRNLND